MAVLYNKVALSPPLAINVKALAERFPDYNYGGPHAATKYSEAITSERIIDPANNYRMILGFDGSTDGQGFTQVMSHVPLDELAYILGRLPPEQFECIKTAFAGTSLEIPTLSRRDIERIQREEVQRVRDREMVEQVRAIGQKQNYGRFTPAEAQGVMQHEMGFTNAETGKPVLGTFGAGPCIAIAVYNPQTKTASMAHIDALTELNSVGALFYQLSQGSDATLEVHLAGGMEMSREQVTDLIKRIQQKPNVVIKSADIIPVNDGFSGKSLAIDSRTGEVYTDFGPNQLDHGPDFDIKMQLLGMQFMRSPIHWGYDGRKGDQQTKSVCQTSFAKGAQDIKPLPSFPSGKHTRGMAFLTETEEIGTGFSDDLMAKIATWLKDTKFKNNIVKDKEIGQWEPATLKK